MNVSSVADKLAQDIRTQDSLHEPMVKDLGKIVIEIDHFYHSYILFFTILAKLAASSAVTEEDFHSTFLKALGR